MISREKIKELIKNKKTIWYVNKDNLGQIPLSNRTDIQSNPNCINNWNLEILFETKEDAEEFLKYGEHTRIVKFEAPTWAELQRMVNSTTEWNVDFCIDCSHKQDLIVSVCRTIGTMDKKQPYIIRLRQFCECKEIDFEYSREGYNKARDLCLELFYGKRSVL